MAEGDTIHRNARRLGSALGARPLLSVEAPSPRSPVRRQTGRARALVGRRLERAEAHGKHLFLRFEGELTLHCHQGMRGSWQVYEPGAAWRKPRRAAWVVLEVESSTAVEFDGSRVAIRTEGELRRDPAIRALGPDLLAPGFASSTGMAALRRRASGSDQLGDALLDQTVIAGIGNIFKSEGCFAAGVDPWRTLRSLDDAELDRVVAETAGLMGSAVLGGHAPHRVYGRRGAPCPRCGTAIEARGQGDANRTTYWCPGCQG